MLCCAEMRCDVMDVLGCSGSRVEVEVEVEVRGRVTWCWLVVCVLVGGSQ